MYLNCLGSLIPNLLAPDDAGEDAAYGTVAHGVVEEWGKSGKRPVHLLGKLEWVEAGDWGFLIEIDKTMLSYCEECIDYVDWLPGEQHWEIKVDFSDLTPIPNQTGTSDHVCLQPKHLTVTDWKFGKGVQVFAENNSQGLLYAYGVFRKYDAQYHFETIEIRIAQPRLNHFDSWTITRSQLLEFAAWAKERMHLAWRLDAPRTPGEKQCQWCKVSNNCVARAALAAKVSGDVFADLIDTTVSLEDAQRFKDDLEFTLHPKLPNPMELTTEQMSWMLNWRGFVDSFWKGLADEIELRAKRGEKIPYRKLVEGRSNRVFRFPHKAGEHLVAKGIERDKVFVTQVVSPSKAEELLRAAGYRAGELEDLLKGHVYKPRGKPTLVPMTDKRPELADQTGDAFADLISETEEI